MLIGNYSVLNKSPGRWLAGSVASNNRSNCNTNGMHLGRFTNSAWSKVDSHPRGYYPPYAWVFAKTAGSMASTNLTNGSCIVTASIAGGLPGEGTAAGSSTATASLGLILPATATSAGSSTVVGSLIGVAAVVGDSAGTSTVTGSVGALASLVVVASGTCTVSGTLTATGVLAGDITPFSELSPETLSTAVWEYPSSLTVGKFIALK